MTIVRCAVVVGCGFVVSVLSGLLIDTGPGLGLENIVGFVVGAAIGLIVVRRGNERG